MVESNAAELFLIPCSIQYIHTKIGNNRLVNHINYGLDSSGFDT